MAACIHILLPVGHAVVGVRRRIPDVRTSRRVELLERVRCNLADRARWDRSAVAAAGEGVGQALKAARRVLGEIALHHPRAGNNLEECLLVRETPALVDAEEEALVVAVVNVRDCHRAADAAAKGCAVRERLGRGRGIGIGNGVPLVVLVIPETAAVQRVRTALGGHHDLAWVAELRIGQHPVGANLRNRLGRRKRVAHIRPAGRALHRHPIDGYVHLVGQRPLQRNTGAVAVLLHAGQCAEDVGRAGPVRARPRVHWQVIGVVAGKVAADGRRIGLDRAHHVAGHLHLLLHGADGQLHVHAQFLAYLQSHPRCLPLLKGRSRHLHCIPAGLHVLKVVIPHSVGLGAANRALIRVAKRDQCAGNHGPRRVLHRADDGALRGLRASLGRGQCKHQQQAERHERHAQQESRGRMCLSQHGSLSPRWCIC